MSNVVTGNHVLTFDLATYITTNPSNTHKQLVEDVMLPVVQELFPDAYYYSFQWGTSNTNYAFIAIPWADGTIDERLFIGIEKNESDTIATGYSDFGVFIGNPGTTNVINISLQDSYLRYDGKIRILGFEDGYAIGTASYSQSSNMKCSKLITKVKGTDGTYKNAVIGNQADNPDEVELYVDINSVITDRRYKIQYPINILSNIGVVSRIDSGDYSHDNLYAYSVKYSSLKGEWLTNTSLLEQSDYLNNMWYDSAFTIGGQTFDAWLFATTSGSGVGICRKHV